MSFSKALPEAQLATLREFQTKFAKLEKHIPFKPGDPVTVSPTAPKRSKGRIGVVIEVCLSAEATRTWIESCGSTYYGSKNEVRVAFLDDDGDVVRLWYEAIDLIPYEPA